MDWLIDCCCRLRQHWTVIKALGRRPTCSLYTMTWQIKRMSTTEPNLEQTLFSTLEICNQELCKFDQQDFILISGWTKTNLLERDLNQQAMFEEEIINDRLILGTGHQHGCIHSHYSNIFYIIIKSIDSLIVGVYRYLLLFCMLHSHVYYVLKKSLKKELNSQTFF